MKRTKFSNKEILDMYHQNMKGVTLKKLVEQTGVTRQTLSRWFKDCKQGKIKHEQISNMEVYLLDQKIRDLERVIEIIKEELGDEGKKRAGKKLKIRLGSRFSEEYICKLFSISKSTLEEF